MSKYKKGDKVRVRKDLKHGNAYCEYVNREMEKMAGMVMEIFKELPSGNYVVCGNNWVWSDDMLEDLTPKDLIQPGYVVKYHDGDYGIVVGVSTGFGDDSMVVIYEPERGRIGRLDRMSEGLVPSCIGEELTIRGKTVDMIFGYPYLVRDAFDVCPGGRPLIWKREPEPKKMTVSEIAKALGYDVEIVKEEGDV